MLGSILSWCWDQVLSRVRLTAPSFCWLSHACWLANSETRAEKLKYYWDHQLNIFLLKTTRNISCVHSFLSWLVEKILKYVNCMFLFWSKYSYDILRISTTSSNKTNKQHIPLQHFICPSDIRLSREAVKCLQILPVCENYLQEIVYFSQL